MTAPSPENEPSVRRPTRSLERVTREFVTDPDGLCARLGHDPFSARVFGVPTVFLADAERAHDALRKHTDALSGRAGNRDVASLLFGNSLLYQDGAEHKRLRVALRALFQPVDREALDTIHDDVELLVREAATGPSMAALQFFRALTTSVTCSYYLGFRPDFQTALEISRLIDDLGVGLYASGPSDAPKSRFQRAVRARSNLDTYVKDRLSADSRLATADLSDPDRADQAVTLLFAGVDTMGATLTWTWWSFANRVHRVQHDTTDFVDEFAETLAERPPVYFIPRGALRDVEIGGATIPRGWNVNIMVNVLHATYTATGDRRCLMPFGKGPKQCPGQVFALTVGPRILRTALATARITGSGGDEEQVGYMPGAHPTASPALDIQPY